MTPAPADGVPTGKGPVPADWTRLSPRMLFVHPVVELVRFAPALIVLLLAGPRDRGVPWVGLASVLVPVAIGVWRWATTTYRLTPDQLQLRTGLLTRNTLTAHLGRVRTVDLTSTPLHRVFFLAKVVIGTGADKPFVLDSLPRDRARHLQETLLRRRAATSDPGHGDHRTEATGPGDTRGSASDAGAAAGADGVSELACFRLGWLRFAPFTLTGLVAVLAVLGFGAQFLDELDWTLAERTVGRAVEGVRTQPWWLLAFVFAILVAVVLTAASVLMYATSYGGFRLTRHTDGTLRVSRGLLTTRATTLDERRLRGAALAEPLLMRPVGGARAHALMTGLRGASSSAESDLLLPPVPRAEAEHVLAQVLRDPEPWRTTLRRHGPRATWRRYVRAVGPSLLVPLAVAVLGRWVPVPGFVWGLTALPFLASWFVGAGRAHSLGHARTGRWLVSRSGLFPRRREVLDLDGVIGWTWSSTLFQRRAGLVTLQATTAAGHGYVRILDVPVATSIALARAGGPGLLEAFLAPVDPGPSRLRRPEASERG